MQPKKSRALIGQLGDVDLRLLRVFKAVADCGGMAAAELELNIAISTISRHVKDLEQRLGLVLCRRGRGGFALTPEGRQLVEAAEQLLSATDAFRGRLHEIHQRLGGDLHMAVFEKTASNPAAQVPLALSRFRDQAPDVMLHVHIGSISSIERGVIDGQFHLGLVPEHRRSERLVYTPLFRETMVLYAGVGHPWFETRALRPGWADLRHQALAGLDYHSPNLMLAHARQLSRQASASDQEAVGLLVLSGRFVGFLPDHYAAPFVESGRLRAVNPEVLAYPCTFSCVIRRTPAPPRAAQAFVAALQAVHAKSLA
ncbi:LysR family transcriptional regulator [Inhella gelatinilytica]|uniref:LysR family transcriptional regulator n=1 Tax=Inhella gelatinilytica TaxID=2795030 RepID=A0A931IWT2_9BURK|nr:LysR family transcriptional regulator [Inhella gelatinilytica]MBH9551483.1 LysR family transcriptional regulator [Inhella gelatinilytica]